MSIRQEILYYLWMCWSLWNNHTTVIKLQLHSALQLLKKHKAKCKDIDLLYEQWLIHLYWDLVDTVPDPKNTRPALWTITPRHPIILEWNPYSELDYSSGFSFSCNLSGYASHRDMTIKGILNRVWLISFKTIGHQVGFNILFWQCCPQMNDQHLLDASQTLK